MHRNRYYGDGVEKVKLAVDAWNGVKCNTVVNLGDTIDRSSKQPAADLDKILTTLNDFKGGPVCNVFVRCSYAGRILHSRM
jgi:hypothetical protein